MNLKETASTNAKSSTEPRKLGVYPRRWVILFVSSTAIFLRGFNQSCYGPINNVLAKYLRIKAWQVDWFVLTQSVVFLSMALPLSWCTSRIGFRNSSLLMTVALSIGFVLTTVGVSLRTGFPSVIIGQCVMGFSNIISWSIPPPTAALWFPSSEVATAVALQVVGRGIGESVGSILTPLLLHTQLPVEVIGFRLLWIFVSVTGFSVLLCVLALLVVKDEPPLPPSESRALVIENKKSSDEKEKSFMEALQEYKTVIKDLFLNPHFVAIWFVFGAVNPVLRNNSVLLSSVLQSAFADEPRLNAKAGLVLMGGWVAYTVGGFIAGPLITKTRKYKHIVLMSVGLECTSTFIVMLGMKFRQLVCIYVGVVSTGLSLGMVNTSLFELILEVTYPKPPMLVTMINIIGMGVFRLLYPIVGRVMLTNLGPTASTTFPFALLLIATIIIAIIKPQYKRTQADLMGENAALLNNENE